MTIVLEEHTGWIYIGFCSSMLQMRGCKDGNSAGVQIWVCSARYVKSIVFTWNIKVFSEQIRCPLNMTCLIACKENTVHTDDSENRTFAHCSAHCDSWTWQFRKRGAHCACPTWATFARLDFDQRAPQFVRLNPHLPDLTPPTVALPVCISNFKHFLQQSYNFLRASCSIAKTGLGCTSYQPGSAS